MNMAFFSFATVKDLKLLGCREEESADVFGGLLTRHCTRLYSLGRNGVMSFDDAMLKIVSRYTLILVYKKRV